MHRRKIINLLAASHRDALPFPPTVVRLNLPREMDDWMPPFPFPSKGSQHGNIRDLHALALSSPSMRCRDGGIG